MEKQRFKGWSERKIFVVLVMTMVAALLTATLTKESILFALTLLAVLISCMAFYLFQYGTLKEFNFEMLSLKANLKQASEEAQVKLEQIVALEAQGAQLVKDLESLRTDLESKLNDVNEKADLASTLAINSNNLASHPIGTI